jgi:hypothetical protein
MKKVVDLFRAIFFRTTSIPASGLETSANNYSELAAKLVRDMPRMRMQSDEEDSEAFARWRDSLGNRESSNDIVSGSATGS